MGRRKRRWRLGGRRHCEGRSCPTNRGILARGFSPLLRGELRRRRYQRWRGRPWRIRVSRRKDPLLGEIASEWCSRRQAKLTHRNLRDPQLCGPQRFPRQVRAKRWRALRNHPEWQESLSSKLILV